jgi:hypothetical protein
MPLGLIARLRRRRRAAVMVAAGLLAVQRFLVGLTMAQAALMLSPDFAGADGFSVICHGNAGAGSAPGTAPEPGKNQHPCCESCMAGAPPATLPQQTIVLRPDRSRVLVSPLPRRASILIEPRGACRILAGASRSRLNVTYSMRANGGPRAFIGDSRR